MKDKLLKKIKILNETIWEDRAREGRIERWLENFEQNLVDGLDEKLHALYLLSKFMYFGENQVKEMLKSLFRDLYKYPLISKIRRDNKNTVDKRFIKREFEKELRATRFLGMGNPSESGTYLLYYFRQENCLDRNLFIHGHDIFKRVSGRRIVKDPTVKHYIFIDDLCSSGKQAVDYSKKILVELKNIKPKIDVQYFTLIGLKDGIERVSRLTKFNKVEAVFILNDSFKCFNRSSRYFNKLDIGIQKAFAKKTCQKYGKHLRSGAALGYSNNQLLLGFRHNIPDNTLPVLCCNGNNKIKWSPVFERIEKRS